MADKTANQLCTAALKKIRAIDARTTPDPNDLADVFDEFIRMLDAWSATGLYVYVKTKDTHTLFAGTQSYTIGSGATIDTGRPVMLEKGSFVRANGLDYPLEIIDRTRYAGLTQKTVGSDYPHFIWYDPTYPNGTIYLWPPGGGELHLWSQKVLAEPNTVDSDCVFPPGYQDAIVFNLAERISPDFTGDPTPFIVGMAQDSRDKIAAMNEANDYPEADLQIWRMNDGNTSYNIDGG